MNVLHLSDLHLNASLQTEVLVQTLVEDLDALEVSTLDAVVASGDITNRATTEEYGLAREFFGRLAHRFKMKRDAFVIVPGNHDVSWDVSKRAMETLDVGREVAVEYRFSGPAGTEPMYVAHPDIYADRFKNFAVFHGDVCGAGYPLDYDQQFTLAVFHKRKVIVVGLNSAWNLNHLDPGHPDIHARAIGNAIDAVTQIRGHKSYLKIAVWHHPLAGAGDDRIREHGFAKRLVKAGFRVGLHGHVHEVRNDTLRYDYAHDGRRLEIIGAGTFGADSHELPRSTPWEYNFVHFDGSFLRTHARHRKSFSDPWGPYGAWQHDEHSQSSEFVINVFDGPRSAGLPLISKRIELLDYLKEQGRVVDGYRFAVESHIFDAKGRILLQRRGPDARDEVDKFEGVGGDLRHEADICAALKRQVNAKLGAEVAISVDLLLEVRPVEFIERNHDRQSWYVVSYLCRLRRGTPAPANPRLTAGLRFFTLDEFFALSPELLSQSTIRARDTYRASFGQVPYFKRMR